MTTSIKQLIKYRQQSAFHRGEINKDRQSAFHRGQTTQWQRLKSKVQSEIE